MRLGILNAYHFDGDPKSYRARYRPMCVAYLSKAFCKDEIKIFEVGQGEWPKSQDAADVWLITGSSKSAYDQDPWILNLLDFVREAHRLRKKMIGVCFGHQIIAQALGGRVEKSEGGWGVGVRKFEIFTHKPWMKPALKNCSLIFSHQDQVVDLPPKATLLGGDDFCPIQMYSLGEHIFCLQGHPEFSKDFAQSRYTERRSLLGESGFNRAIESLHGPTHSTEVGLWLRQFCDDSTGGSD